MNPWIARWLGLIALMIFAMVVVGGATRLTGSGLSITEWKPILGTIPPLNAADWNEVFDKYKLSSQYKLQNQGMSLADFQFIFWWEWAHRLLGRLVGFVFAVPFIWFALRKQLPQGLWPKLLGLLILGGAQGALGWYMVASGLVDRVSVSQYRLAAHLTLASILFASVLWTMFAISKQSGFKTLRLAQAMPFLVLLQIAAGAFVAGLDAGQGYNTWPLMDGQVIPQGLGAIEPAWKNLFENALTVQFNHRLLAYGILALASIHALRSREMSSKLLVVAILAQASLGIATLLWHVPLALALLHQAGAMFVLGAAVWTAYAHTARA
jgi:heme a synthase